MGELNGMEGFEGENKLPRRGDLVDAKVVVVDDRGVWLSIGSTKYDAHLPIEEMADELAEKLQKGEIKEGDTIKVVVSGVKRDPEEGTTIINVSQKDLFRREIIEKLLRARDEEEIIRVKPTGVEPNRKGVIVDFGYDIKGFIPASQLDTRFVSPERLDRYVGRNLRVKVLRVNPRRGNAILSAKAVLKDEMEKRKKRFFENTKPGDIVRGRVVRVTDEDVIVELEKGVIGKVPFEELDWRKIKNPQSFVKRGDVVKAYVMDIDPETEEIKLSLRLAKPNPWEQFAERHPVGSIVSGRILKVIPKVLVIRVGNIVGIVPRSEMTWKKVFNPEELFKRGDYVKAVVKEIDVDNQRAVFSIKEALPDPWETIRDHYKEGDIVEGIVKAIKDFGVFVEVGEGIEGLVSKDQISWTPFNNIEDVVKVGDRVRVKIKNIDPSRRRMTLSIKEAMPDPFKEYKKQHGVGSLVRGKVKEVSDKGLVIEITPDITGFIVNGQISKDKIEDIPSKYPVGSEIEAKIVGYDEQKRIVKLSRRVIEEEKEKEEVKPFISDDDKPHGSYRLGELLKDLLDNKGE